jgi:mevalonate kinase
MATALSKRKEKAKVLGLSTYKISVPGSLMLFGEHAVLHGHHAISCAIDKHLSASLTPRNDDTIEIFSALGTHRMTISAMEENPMFRFVIRAIQKKQPLLPSGFSLEIESQFSHLFGLGSSAAVTVAVGGALSLWLDGKIDNQQLFHESLSIIRDVQGIASGADVAASIFGGIVFYRMDPCLILPLPHLFPLTVIYSGSKMATKEVIAYVQARSEKNAKLFELLFSSMNEVSKRAKEAIFQKNWKELGELCTAQQGLMEAIGVSNESLSEIVYLLRKQPEILGSKISGSGLGDCVIGLGHASLPALQYPVLEVQMSRKGISHE